MGSLLNCNKWRHNLKVIDITISTAIPENLQTTDLLLFPMWLCRSSGLATFNPEANSPSKES